jgi:hypothetical protein
VAAGLGCGHRRAPSPSAPPQSPPLSRSLRLRAPPPASRRGGAGGGLAWPMPCARQRLSRCGSPRAAPPGSGSMCRSSPSPLAPRRGRVVRRRCHLLGRRPAGSSTRRAPRPGRAACRARLPAVRPRHRPAPRQAPRARRRGLVVLARHTQAPGRRAGRRLPGPPALQRVPRHGSPSPCLSLVGRLPLTRVRRRGPRVRAPQSLWLLLLPAPARGLRLRSIGVCGHCQVWGAPLSSGVSLRGTK